MISICVKLSCPNILTFLEVKFKFTSPHQLSHEKNNLTKKLFQYFPKNKNPKIFNNFKCLE